MVNGCNYSLLAHVPLSSLASLPMITHTPLVARNLPIKTLAARGMEINIEF